MKAKLFIIITGIILLLAACAPQGSPSIPTPLPTFAVAQKPTYTVERGDVIKILELRGRVSAVKQEDLYFGTNGVVDEVLVKRGDMVKAGQILGYLSERVTYELAVADAKLELIKAQKALDALAEEAGLRSAEALVAMLKAQSDFEEAKNDRISLEKPRASALMIQEAETQLALAEANVREAYKQWENAQNLPLDDPTRAAALMNISSAQRERDRARINLNWYTGHATEEQIFSADAKLALEEAKYQEAVRKYESIKDGPNPLDVDLAEANLIRAELNLKKAQTNLDGLTITAAFDGQVLSLSLSPGMQVTAYKTVLTLVDPKGLEITLNPTAAELAEISVGQSVVVRLPNNPGQEYEGSVRFLPLPSSNSTPSQENDQSVRISLKDGNTILTMGEVATVQIQIEKHENVLWVSPAALRTFQNRDFVIIQDGEIQRRVDIQLGLTSKERVEILAGLSDGQVVLGP